MLHEAARTIYTIGHSNRSFDDFVALLHEHHVKRLADIRRYPGSRRLPHFSREALEQTLPARGIAYEHHVQLGGRRKPDPDSENTGLRNEQFRAYADYMGTGEFAGALDSLLSIQSTTAIMCAEAVPWRCHRNLVSDELLRRGLEVVHILGRGQIRAHSFTQAAKVVEDRVMYPPDQQPLDFGEL
jgi:uncharacterized protein (DUF488 family)